MPTYDVSSRHTIRIAASPARVYEAARHADLGRPWLVRALMRLRSIPSGLASRLGGGRRPLGGADFTLVAEAPGEEFVLGIMGRFWMLRASAVPASAEQFGSPPPAGLAQAVWNFRVTPVGTGTELSTETRVRCGDPATRRQFGRYWRIIRLGSGLIRGSILRYIRATAERR